MDFAWFWHGFREFAKAFWAPHWEPPMGGRAKFFFYENGPRSREIQPERRKVSPRCISVPDPKGSAEIPPLVPGPVRGLSAFFGSGGPKSENFDQKKIFTKKSFGQK